MKNLNFELDTFWCFNPKYFTYQPWINKYQIQIDFFKELKYDNSYDWDNLKKLLKSKNNSFINALKNILKNSTNSFDSGVSYLIQTQKLFQTAILKPNVLNIKNELFISYYDIFYHLIDSLNLNDKNSRWDLIICYYVFIKLIQLKPIYFYSSQMLILVVAEILKQNQALSLLLPFIKNLKKIQHQFLKSTKWNLSYVSFKKGNTRDEDKMNIELLKLIQALMRE